MNSNNQPIYVINDNITLSIPAAYSCLMSPAGSADARASYVLSNQRNSFEISLLDEIPKSMNEYVPDTVKAGVYPLVWDRKCIRLPGVCLGYIRCDLSRSKVGFSSDDHGTISLNFVAEQTDGHAMMIHAEKCGPFFRESGCPEIRELFDDLYTVLLGLRIQGNAFELDALDGQALQDYLFSPMAENLKPFDEKSVLSFRCPFEPRISFEFPEAVYRLQDEATARRGGYAIYFEDAGETVEILRECRSPKENRKKLMDSIVFEVKVRYSFCAINSNFPSVLTTRFLGPDKAPRSKRTLSLHIALDNYSCCKICIEEDAESALCKISPKSFDCFYRTLKALRIDGKPYLPESFPDAEAFRAIMWTALMDPEMNQSLCALFPQGENDAPQETGHMTRYGNVVCDLPPHVKLPQEAKTVGAGYAYTDVEDVIIPEGVEELGAGAFEGCSRLRSVKFPASLKRIGDFAFSFCESLNEVILPEGLESMGEKVFFYSSLRFLSVPGSLQSVDGKVLDGAEDLERVWLAEGISRIGAHAFHGRRKLHSIRFPSTLREIGDNAFVSCHSIKSLTIPEGVEKIGESVFSGCSKLCNVTLPGSLKNVSERMFLNIKSLQEVTLSEGIESIDDSAFASCFALRKVNFPTSLRSIGKSAFFCSRLEELVLPEGLEQLETDSFKHCNSLRSIRLPGSLKSVQAEAFEKLRDLEEVVISEGIFCIESGAFRDCKNLRSVHLPSSLEAIEKFAFMGCESLESIELPENLAYIGDGAFNSCSALRVLKLPSSLEVIDFAAFTGCALTHIDIPDNVTEIGYAAFSYCTALRSVRLPASLDEISAALFEGCGALETVELPDTVKTIGMQAFLECAALKSVILSGSEMRIEPDAFAGCNRLTIYFRLSDSNGVSDCTAERFANKRGIPFVYVLSSGHTVPEGSRAETKNIPFDIDKDGVLIDHNCADEHLVLPEGVCEVAKNVFSGNRRIRSVTFPSSLKKLSERAFYDCPNLEMVTFAEGAERIGYEAFARCVNLRRVELPSTLWELSDYVFAECKALEALDIPDKVFLIPNHLCENCTKLRQVHFPAALHKIGGFAFENCESLESIVIPEGCVEISIYAFSHCRNLRSVSLPHSLRHIDSNAFENCTSLESLLIPEGVETIYGEVFIDCESLQRLVLPDSLRYIGPKYSVTCEDFRGCKNLTIYASEGSEGAIYARMQYVPCVYTMPSFREEQN